VNAPRRTPNFTRFIATGAILGFVVGAVAALVGDQAPGLSENSAMFYIGVFGAAIGAVLGALVAVAFDRRG
jgi:ABC-type transport system involved in cytochrome c biogenesis permease subunit